MQFISDLVHILEEYKTDGDSGPHSAVDDKLLVMKKEKKKLEKLCMEMENRSSELAETNYTS